jgi:hypothetical protein
VSAFLGRVAGRYSRSNGRDCRGQPEQEPSRSQSKWRYRRSKAVAVATGAGPMTARSDAVTTDANTSARPTAMALKLPQFAT